MKIKICIHSADLSDLPSLPVPDSSPPNPTYTPILRTHPGGEHAWSLGSNVGPKAAYSQAYDYKFPML